MSLQEVGYSNGYNGGNSFLDFVCTIWKHTYISMNIFLIMLSGSYIKNLYFTGNPFLKTSLMLSSTQRILSKNFTNLCNSLVIWSCIFTFNLILWKLTVVWWNLSVMWRVWYSLPQAWDHKSCYDCLAYCKFDCHHKYIRFCTKVCMLHAMSIIF